MMQAEVPTPRRRRRRWVWRAICLLLVPVLLWAGWYGWAFFALDPPEPATGSGATSTDAHPWVVAISYPERWEDDPSAKGCVGALVDPNVVVTAAHCLVHTPPEEMEVVAGRDDLRTDDGVTVGVSEVWVHPDREEGDTSFPLQGIVRQVDWPPADIGLVFLEEELPHETIPLADGDMAPDGVDHATMLGYRIEPQDVPLLWEQPALVVDDETCVDRMDKTRSPAPVVLHGVRYDVGSYMCVGVDDEAIRAMGTDSGSPLVADGRLVGVLSWSIGIDLGDPQYFTRVSTYSTEIQDLIEEAPAAADTA